MAELPTVAWCLTCGTIAAHCDLLHPLNFVEAKIIPPETHSRDGWLVWDRPEWAVFDIKQNGNEKKVLVVELD